MNQKACFSSIGYISCKAVLLAVNTLRDLYFACQSGSRVAYYEIVNDRVTAFIILTNRGMYRVSWFSNFYSASETCEGDL